MSFPRLGPLARAVGCLGCLALVPGCLEQLEDGGAIVNIFSTHHASPEDGIYPDRGDDEMPRIFSTDEGWTVTLLESYVTMSAVSIVSCNGLETPLNMFWGPCPENMHKKDLETLTVAGLKVDSGDYCQLRVEYGPYETPVIDQDTETQHAVPENTAVDGATVYLRGAATMGEDGEPVQFELINTKRLVVELDLSEIDEGDPLTVEHRENFPKQLTVSKTYDRFFDSIDFTQFDAEAARKELDDVLEDETFVVEGTIVQAALNDN